MNVKNILAKILVLTSASLLIGVLLSIARGGRTFYPTLQTFSILLLLPIALMAPLNYALRLAKWNVLLNRLGVAVNRRSSTLTFLAGLGLGLIPGKLGEFANPYLLNQLDGVETDKSMAAVLMLRYTDVLSVLALALLSSRAFPWATLPLAAVSLACVFAGLAFASDKWLERLKSASPLRIQPMISRLKPAQQGFGQLLNASTMSVALGLGCISWACEGFIVYLALRGFGVEVRPLASVFVVAFSTVGAGLSLLPGGIGVAEASIAALLAQLGIEPAVGAIVTIITRISTVWLGALIGAAALYIVARKISSKEAQD